jgi:predicted transcriptional regulator
MAKSQHAIGYRPVPELLREMREEAGLTQRDLATRMGRPQPWVHKTEVGSRRIDISEFLEWCMGCKVDPVEAFKQLIRRRS